VVEGASPRELHWSFKGGKYPLKMSLAPVLASRWEKNNEKGKELILVSNDSAQKQAVVVDGHKMDLEPYSWHGLEVKREDERKITGKMTVPLPAAAKGNDEVKATEGYVFGPVLGIDIEKKLLTVESVDSEGNTAVKKTLKFQIMPESKFEAEEGLGKLSIGDMVEVYYQKQGEGQEFTGIVEKIIYKPEGRKPEEG